MLSEHNKSLIDAVREVLSKSPDLEAEELSSAQREFLRAQRSTINTLLKNGIISDKSYEYLIAEIDAGLIESQANWPAFYGQAVNRYNAINRLSIAVVHEQDMENAISALTKIGFVVTCLPSIGGFLRRRNISLLIGYEKGQEEAVVVALNKSCRKRIDYLVNPTTLTNHVPLIPTPITVAGATIFSFEVERFEIF